MIVDCTGLGSFWDPIWTLSFAMMLYKHLLEFDVDSLFHRQGPIGNILEFHTQPSGVHHWLLPRNRKVVTRLGWKDLFSNSSSFPAFVANYSKLW